MNKQYRNDLDRIGLSQRDREALIRSLSARGRAAAPRPRRALRLTAAAAVIVCLLAAVAVAAVTGAPVLRDYFGGGAGYRQSAGFLGSSVTVDGWTMALTDCVGDDRYLWLGLELTAPEGTVLDADHYALEDYSLTLPGQRGYVFSSGYRQLPDQDPGDNRIQFALLVRGGLQQGSFNGANVAIKLGGLSHAGAWSEAEGRAERVSDFSGSWDFGVLTVSYPDNTIRLEPNLPVTTLDVEAVITQVEVSPIGVYVRIEGDTLVGHHEWVPENAPDGYYGCMEYQDITLYTTDGEAITPYDDLSGSGCSGGDRDHPEPGYLRLVRANDALLDLDSLDHISVCGVDIPLH